MPFSRYEIRNEFSLADPELYKSADKDDPEALLEGVAMAGLVGVLRQLGDLAEFAAEIFHGLHEEVMVTAARGHGLLVRVQQVESDFPSIERAFLSQTGHSAFFSSSGISWHPNLQVEQNLITKGDLPRFVMDSYEESRGPPRLFLLDKFDVAGAGACLKRYTDPSFFKVETSSYEMMNAETQRDKKIRKTKKKGARWKNGETPEVFQSSHVKLHQLLLEERVRNVASEPARRVKLKKREIKFPFDTETGKGYMEKLLNSPPEDKLVHEVSVGYSPPTLPSNSPGEPGVEPLEVRMVKSPLVSPYESPIVDKAVSSEHMDNLVESIPEMQVSEHSNSSIELQDSGVYSGMEDDIEEKHISINREDKEDGIEDSYRSDDVASETDNFMDALATMESEVETDAELRANSDPTIKQLQSHSSDSQSASDDESSPIKKKITSFSYSDATSTSAESMSPRGVISSQAFASTEIPFRPRVSPNQSFDNRIEVGDFSSHESTADAALPVDQGAIFKEGNSKESNLSEISSNNCLDVNSPKRFKETEIDPEEIIASSSFVENKQWEVDNEDNNENSSLVRSHVEEQTFDSLEESGICDGDVKPSEPSFSGDIQAVKEISDDVLKSKSDPAESELSYSSEDETEYKDRETISVFSESKDANANVYEPADDINGDDNLHTLEDVKEMKEEDSESVNLETNGLIPGSVTDYVNNSESKVLSTCEDATLEYNEYNGLSTTEEHAENGLVISQSGIVQRSSEYVEKESSDQSVILPELDSITSASYGHPNIHYIDSNQNNGFEHDVDNPSTEKESFEFGEQKESNEPSVVSPELDSIHSAFYDHSKIQDLDNAPTSSSPSISGDVNENDVNNPSANLEILHGETLFAMEKTDEDVHNHQFNAQFPDSRAPGSAVSANDQEPKTSKLVDQDVESESPEKDGKIDELEAAFMIQLVDQDVESESPEKDGKIDELEAASSIMNHSVPIEEKADQPHMQSIQLEIVDSQNHVDQETHVNHLSESEPVDQESYCLEQSKEFQDSPMAHLSQLSSQVNLSGFNMLPQLAPINMEEMPPLPPLPPMQWRMGKLQNSSSISGPDGGQHDIHHFPSFFPQIESHSSLDQNENVTKLQNSSLISGPDGGQHDIHHFPPSSPQIESHLSLDQNENVTTLQNSSLISGPDGGQHDIHHFPPSFPQIESHPSLDQNENATNDKSEHDYEDLNTEETDNLVVSSESNAVKFDEKAIPQPPSGREQFANVSPSGREIIRPSSTSSLPLVNEDGPNGIRPMKIQRPRTPLINAVAAHDKTLLKKVSERAVPLFPKEEERDTLLEQIRAKSINLKPAVQTRPSIQGPSTNLRVAAILEKANAIRQAFAGSDDDEDDDDSWSDS